MTFCFLVAFSCLLTHEMDAVRRHEWHVFPLLARLTNDELGYCIFTLVHIPLYGVLLWGLLAPGAGGNQALVVGLDSFCIVHVVLHLLAWRHPASQFANWFSWALIGGAGLAGGVDLLFRW